MYSQRDRLIVAKVLLAAGLDMNVACDIMATNARHIACMNAGNKHGRTLSNTGSEAIEESIANFWATWLDGAKRSKENDEIVNSNCNYRSIEIRSASPAEPRHAEGMLCCYIKALNTFTVRRGSL